MKTSPVGMRCPECAGERPDIRRPRALAGSRAPATLALIAVNAIAFIAELGAGGALSAADASGRAIRDAGLFGPAIADGDWWRLVTGGFLHAGPLHLLMNMFALYVLGSLLEPGIGSARFVGVYTVSLLAGSFGALVADPNLHTVGASGAIFGVMAATIVVARGRGLNQVASQIGFWLVINVAFTLGVPGISIGGHLGGLVGGALAAVAVVAGERTGDPRRAAMVLAVGLTAIGAASVAGALLVV
jgi:membrane associated rhomboid family serine protease